MTGRALLAAAALALLGGVAAAGAPEVSPRPLPRPVAVAPEAPAVTPAPVRMVQAAALPAAARRPPPRRSALLAGPPPTPPLAALPVAEAALATLEDPLVTRAAAALAAVEARAAPLPAPLATLPALARRAPPARAPAPAVPPAPVPAVAQLAPATASAIAASLRPRPRPAGLHRRLNPAAAVPVVQVVSAQAVPSSLRPRPRPDNLRRLGVVRASAMVPVPDPQGPRGGDGSVCGDPAIRGERLSRIAGRVQGCGIDEPVRVTEVDGVRLSVPVTVDCPTAQALRTWVSRTARPEIGRLGGGLRRLEIMGHYACRPRNNQSGARISEHGRGRAVDIGGVTLENGATISILSGWRDPQHGAMLRALHRGACGPFGTVLGPQADRFHQNHLHFDTARHRSGPFCR